MTRLLRATAFCTGAIVLLAGVAGAEEATLVRDAQPNATIVLPEGTSDAVKASAEALRKSIKESFGVEIPVVVESAKPAGALIRVGERSLAVCPAGDNLASIEAHAELVCEKVHRSTIHGWHSNRLLRYGGTMYACATLPIAPGEKDWDAKGVFLRREADGKWSQAGDFPHQPYLMCAGPDGRFWVLGSTSFLNLHVYRMKNPLDFGSFEELYTGTNAYMGAGISPEGNLLVLHAENYVEKALSPNAVIAAFYDNRTNKWRLNRLDTPEGRNGYEGIILRGNRGLAVLNSTINDPAHAAGGTYSWRHVRLARCEDLSEGLEIKPGKREPGAPRPWSKNQLSAGKWTNVRWLMPADGRTALQDFVVAPDGYAYLSYAHVSAESDEAMKKMAETPHYVARIHEDLTTDIYPTGLKASATRLIIDDKGKWYILGRPAAGGNLRLWAVSPERAFAPVKEYVINNTEKLEAYVIHLLCPARFGGESDGNTIHILSSRVPKDAVGKELDYAELWYAEFNLPNT
jgi:hypothetical protein